jgi:glycosyltransferase involved in cell wall biosynthesis
MISLILTVFNEVDNIERLCEDILCSSLLPDEVVVVDAGSTDGTAQAISAFGARFQACNARLRLYVEPGVNIARGRNSAIAKASHEIIAVTDAGCTLEKQWLERITQPIRGGEADMVGGFFKPVAKNEFQRVLAALTVAQEPPANFLPSSRSIAFTRSVWSRVGGYPEHLPWGEDTLFNTLCIQAGARYVVAPEALVHWEVRRSPAQALKQYYRYAYGDGLARRVSGSQLLVQGVYWSCIALFLAGYLRTGLLVFALFQIAILIKRRGVAPRDFLASLLLLTGIQSARFWGYCLGLINGCAGSKK